MKRNDAAVFNSCDLRKVFASESEIFILHPSAFILV
jgi:hypothetical protein